MIKENTDTMIHLKRTGRKSTEKHSVTSTSILTVSTSPEIGLSFNFSNETTEHTIPYLFPRLTETQHQFWPTVACFLAHKALSPHKRHPLVQCPAQKE